MSTWIVNYLTNKCQLQNSIASYMFAGQEQPKQQDKDENIRELKGNLPEQLEKEVEDRHHN